MLWITVHSGWQSTGQSMRRVEWWKEKRMEKGEEEERNLEGRMEVDVEVVGPLGSVA
jgi:hypothetical protein